MGFKLAVVIAPLDGSPLRSFVDEVYGVAQSLVPCEMMVDRALYPSSLSERYALAHEGFGWIFDWHLTDRAFERPFPVRRPMCSFTLHSVVNLYGFMAQSNGEYVRCRLGDADGGIRADIGNPSAKERALVAAFATPGQEGAAWEAWTGKREAFDGVWDDMTHDGMGEGIVFGLMDERVGFRLDMFSPEVELFLNAAVLRIAHPDPKSFLGWLSGRR